MTDTSDLYTTVKNPLATDRVYGYLGRHGKLVLAGASYTQFGNLADAIRPVKRKHEGLERDLLANRIEILSTPKPIFYDTTADVAVANPTVTVTRSASAGGTLTSLATGSYRAAYTFVNEWGETTIGTSECAAITLTNGASKPQLGLPALPSGVDSINIYLTLAGGASGSEVLYDTGVTATTYDLVAANTGTIPVPLFNKTKGATVNTLSVVDEVLGVVDPSWGRYTL